MARFAGKIGFAQTTESETKPGVWEDKIIERTYYGDVNKRKYNNRSSNNGINDNVTVSNEVSVVADLFASNNYHLVRYVEYRGVKWKVSSVDLQPPRLILSLEEIYNA